MADQPSLKDLLARVEAATGGDRELDALIASHFRVGPDDEPDWLKRWGGEFRPHHKFPGSVTAMHSDGSTGVHWKSERYTTSLDAALALVERVLPEANCVGFDKIPGEISAYVSRNFVGDGHWYQDATSHTPALALIAALLRALITQEPDNG